MARKILLGTKFFEHDSSLVLLDPEKKKIFALSTERITRIKHDYASIDTIFRHYQILNDSDQFFITHTFADFSRLHDQGLETLGSSYYKYRIIDLLQEAFGFKYIKDRNKVAKKLQSFWGKIEISTKLLIRLGPNFITFLYLLVRYVVTLDTPTNNKRLITKYIYETCKKYGARPQIDYLNHHLAHAVGAYYFSPFFPEKTLVFTIDGRGDSEFSTLWEFDKDSFKKIAGSNLEIFKGAPYPVASIGIVYTLCTKALGFSPNADEGKTEALAAYGKQDERLTEILNGMWDIDVENLKWVSVRDHIRPVMNESFMKMWVSKIGEENFAATVQKWLEHQVVTYLCSVHKKLKSDNLILAGGVAANVIMNLRIQEKTPFKNFYIFPAMGDEGTAAGAAIFSAVKEGYDLSWLKECTMPYWGPSATKEEVKEELAKPYWREELVFEYIGDAWPQVAASEVHHANIIALFNGQMEFGPRALGNRSIVANPLKEDTRDRINKTVKRRPYFQPFCPSVLSEERTRYFENSYDHKYMATAFYLKDEFRSTIPSGAHIDGTARPQFVSQSDNPGFYQLISEFKKLSGFGIVINTSFNLHGRTIVRTPADAFRDFIDCNIDSLFIEGFHVRRL